MVDDESALTDEDLVERARRSPEGDLRPFERLVERYQSRVVANCRHLGGRPADAEDLAQEVFVKTYFGLGRFEGRSTFKTWLYRIKANHCINFLKKSRRATFVDVEEEVAGTDPRLRVEASAEAHLRDEDRRRDIERVLEGIPDTLRVPLVMRDSDEMSYQDIADALGIGLSATKMRIKRGREEFRRRYDPAPGSAVGDESSPGHQATTHE